MIDNVIRYTELKKKDKRLEKHSQKHGNSNDLKKDHNDTKKDLDKVQKAIKMYPSTAKVAIKIYQNKHLLNKVQKRLKERERERRNKEAIKKLTYAKLKIQNQRAKLLKNESANRRSLDKLNAWEQNIDTKIGKYKDKQNVNQKTNQSQQKKQKQNQKMKTKTKSMSL